MRRYLMKKMLKESWQNIRKFPFFSIASSGVVMILMAFFILLIMVVLNMQAFSEQAQEKLAISVFIDYEADEEAIAELRESIQSAENVDQVTFVSKDESIQDMIAHYGKAFELLEGDVNPLYDKFEVSVLDEQQIKQTSRAFQELPEVYEVSYGNDQADGLLRLVQSVQKIGAVVLIVSQLFTILILVLTLVLGINSRQEEIQTRSLLGATPRYVALPFVLQAIVLTTIGGALAMVLSAGGYFWFMVKQRDSLAFFGYHLLPFRELILTLTGAILVGSVVVGWISAKLAVKISIRYPK